ncbi:MAG: TlpA disulfide reductase family protein [Acidobacteria bacterium]|nr:TlpA disulfide reductase family protein [Acidobacteriota bacterium]MDA1233958.1 TlpA disulfide reductase family protein [Acidobacteriota bacterium]
MNRLLATLILSAVVAFGAGELSERRAPGFSLPDVNLEQHDLYDFRGKVVVLNIMKTSCPHCQVLSKVLNEAETHYGGAVKVLSIVHPPDSLSKVQAYLKDNNLSTTILFDSGQVAASYMKLTPENPSFATPHFFIIDQDGQIREDYGYEPLARNIFQGYGIYGILDRYVKPPEVARAK